MWIPLFFCLKNVCVMLHFLFKMSTYIWKPVIDLCKSGLHKYFLQNKIASILLNKSCYAWVAISIPHPSTMLSYSITMVLLIKFRIFLAKMYELFNWILDQIIKYGYKTSKTHNYVQIIMLQCSFIGHRNDHIWLKWHIMW